MIRYIKGIWWRLRDWAVGPAGWLIADATPAEQHDLSRLDLLDGLDAREAELDEMERAGTEVDEDTDWMFSDGLGDEFEAELEQWERRRDS